MKTNTLTLVFSLFLLIFFKSCSKDQIDSAILKGKLSIDVGLFINVTEVNDHLKSTLGAENFKVSIFNSEGTEVLSFAKASDIPDVIELAIGSYYVSAHSNNNLPAAFDNPYYYGESELFEISPNASRSVIVNCELANTMISIVYSENVRNAFTDYTTTVQTSAGILTYTKDENRAGYFQSLPISISALLSWQKTDGTIQNKTLKGAIPNPQPGKHYEIYVDATIDISSAILSINLDENPDSTEIVLITDESDQLTPGTYAPGALIITEIMYDPYNLTDANGEWFEVYNTTDDTINLYNLVIRKNDTESHIIGNRITLVAPDAYFVLARNNLAVTVGKYIYSGISLNNDGAIISIYNYGTNGSDGTMICSVSYGEDGFPKATGASLCLDPQKLNITDALSGDSWCISKTLFSTGDLGTPGLSNDQCD
jgi:hypothetical protein